MPYVKGVDDAEYIQYFSQKLDLIKELMEAGISLTSDKMRLYRSNSIYFGKFGAIVAHYREEPIAPGFPVQNIVRAVCESSWQVSVEHPTAPRYDTEVCTELWIRIYHQGNEQVCVLQLIVFDDPKLPLIATSHAATWLLMETGYDGAAGLHFC